MSTLPSLHCPTLPDLPPPPPGKSGWPWTEASPALPATLPDGSPWPKVSIVTPSYNQGPFIEETIRSVLLQGYPNLEYLVIDGGSADESVDIIRKYEPWLTYWVSQPDRGQTDAIQKGFDRASGQIFAWLNSDDYYTPGAIGAAAARFSELPGAAAVYGDCIFVDGASLVLWPAPGRPSSLESFLLGDMPISQPSCFFLTEEIAAVDGLDIELEYVMDQDLWLKLAHRGASFHHVPRVWSHFRLSPGSKTYDRRIHFWCENLTIVERLLNTDAALQTRYGEEARRRFELLIALEHFLAGDSVDGERRLEQLLSTGLPYGDPRELAKSIAWYLGGGIAASPHQVQAALDCVIASLERLAPATARDLYAHCAFWAYRHGDRPRTALWSGRALLHDPTSRRNRGLWSILLRASLPIPAASRRSRPTTRREHTFTGG